MSEAMLTMRGVSASYGQGLAVEALDMVVNAGATTVVLGANGAGKSTTLKLMAGLLQPSDGSLTAAGGTPIRTRRGRVIRPGVAMSPEGRRLFAQMTVEENLLIGGTRLTDPRPAADKLAEVYDLFPRVSERRKQLAGTLSGGEQQMVAIGRALMREPELLLLDEPTLGLSPRIVGVVTEMVRQIAGMGMTIVLVEQDASVALSLADQVYVLANGRVRLASTAADIDVDQVMAAYFGTDHA